METEGTVREQIIEKLKSKYSPLLWNAVEWHLKSNDLTFLFFLYCQAIDYTCINEPKDVDEENYSKAQIAALKTIYGSLLKDTMLLVEKNLLFIKYRSFKGKLSEFVKVNINYLVVIRDYYIKTLPPEQRFGIIWELYSDEDLEKLKCTEV
jgi:hypothetical protein